MSEIKLTADSGGGTTSLKAPSSTTSNADVVLKLPVADGSANQVLKTDGSGQLSFTSNAGTTINNNTNDCIVTATGTANELQGESELRWQNGNNLFVRAGEGESATLNLIADQGDDNGDGWKIQSEQDENDLTFKSNISGSYVDKLKLKSNAALECQGDLSAPNVVVTGSGSVQIPDSIVHIGDTNTKIRFPADDNITMEVAGSEVFRVTPDAAHGSSQSIQLRVGHTIDGATVNMGGTKAYSAGIIRGQVNVRDAQAYDVTDNGGGIGFSAIFNNGGSHTTMSQIEGVKANNTDGNYRGAIKFSTRHHNGNMVEKVRIGQEGLSFEGATADANCIKDYEEGTFTLSVAAGGFSSISGTGKYTKIGQICCFSGDFSLAGSGNSSVLRMSGLPFNNTGHWTSCSGYFQNYSNEGSQQASFAVVGNMNEFRVVEFGNEMTGNTVSAGYMNIAGLYHVA